MKNLILIVISLFMLSGCLGLEVQIVSNEEAGAGPTYIAEELAKEHVKIKYPNKVNKLVQLSDAVINALSDKDIENAFNSWKDYLVNLIKDENGRIAVRALLACYDIKIDGSVNFDDGQKDKIIKAVTAFRKMLTE